MKAQAAIEYLMTYGWAVLVIIIVSAALYSLGVFSPGTWTQKSARGFSSFIVDDWKFDSNGNLYLRIGNRVGSLINITNVSVTYDNKVNCNSTSTQQVYPGEHINIFVDDSSNNCSTGNKFGSPSLNSPLNLKVEIKFYNTVSGLNHYDSGTLIGSVES